MSSAVLNTVDVYVGSYVAQIGCMRKTFCFWFVEAPLYIALPIKLEMSSVHLAPVLSFDEGKGDRVLIFFFVFLARES